MTRRAVLHAFAKLQVDDLAYAWKYFRYDIFEAFPCEDVPGTYIAMNKSKLV